MNTATPSLLTAAPVLHYEILSSQNVVNNFDGNKVATDKDGEIVAVQYADGSTVRRHSSYIMVQSVQAGMWFGDKQGRWFTLD
jgi:hypothetical protein